MLTPEQQTLVNLVVERAEQACRYALKHQNFDSNTNPEYQSGWTVAAEVCEGAIRRQVESHIEADLADAVRPVNPTPQQGLPGEPTPSSGG